MVKIVKNKKIIRKSSFLLLIAFSALLFFSFKNIPVGAVSIDCDGYDGDLKKECEDKKDEAKDLEKIINLKEKQENTIQNQLQLINLEQSRTKADLARSQQKLQDLTGQIQSLTGQIQEKSRLIDYQRKILVSLIQSYYEDYQQGVLDVVLANQNFSEILNQSDYIEQSSTKVSEILKSIQDTKKSLESEQADLEQKKNESENVKADLQDKNLSLQYSEDKKQVLLGQTQADKQKYEKLLSDIEDEIDQLQSTKGEADTSNLPPLKKGYFTYPVNPVVISQSYGKTSFSKHYTSGKHNGIDFSIKYKNVFAAKGGKILATGNNGRYAYGRWVAIDHGDGLVTLYGHFSKVSVSKGKSVSEGDTIGTSGNTGFSTGPHLHFSVFSKSSFEVVESKNVSGLMIPIGASVNPMRYLK